MVCFLLLVGLLPAVGTESVRKVDFSQTPEMKELAARARQLGNEMYPKAISLLTEDASTVPRQFNITFKKRLMLGEMRGVGEIPGYVRGWRHKTIYLNAEWFAFNPTNFDSIFLHEIAHVAQPYAWRAPSHWTEGIADYVSCKLGCTNDSHCTECAGMSWHYRAGYSCAAALLLYVESNYRSNVVRELNTALRRGSYKDSFFERVTGENLDQLWTEFKKTSAYKPSATEARNFFKEMGYTNPPSIKQLRALFKRQAGGKFTLQAHNFLSELAFKRQLPGFRKGETPPSVLRISTSKENSIEAYPVSRTFDSSLDGAAIVHHYLLVRASWHSAWKLQRAWRTDRDGSVLEEYRVH